MNEELLEYFKNIPQDQMAGMIEYLQQNNSGGSTVSTTPNTFGQRMGKAGQYAMDNIGPIVQGAQGVTELAFNLFGNSGVHKDERGNQMGSDIYGRPLYSYQNYQNSIDDIESRAKSEQGKSTLSGSLSGLKGGAAIGTMFGGPAGAAIGGAIGAVGGAIGGLIGGNKREKQLEKEASSRKKKLTDSTINFNNENASFFEESQADSINSYLMSERSRRLA